MSHNSQDGQPRPLAYRLDTLVVNRRIEEAGDPSLSVLKLGSFCNMRVSDSSENLAGGRLALYQNAFAAIVAQVRCVRRDKSKRLFEFGTTRYGVILTGEELPDGTKADAIYIMLNPVYRELLNKFQLRPLD